MGQKVNPYGFRLGITTDWKSRWFEERHYREFVVEDWKIRDYLMRQLEAAAVSRIDRGKILASLAARETLGSTGLGQGVAIPHGRIRGLKQALAAVVRLVEPVAFDAPDGRPVALLVALLVPEHATQEHLELLSELAQMLSDRDLRTELLTEPSAAALRSRIAAWEPIRPAA